MLIPVGGLFGVEPDTKARKNLIIYTFTLAILGITYLFLPTLNLLGILFMLGIFFYGFVANYLVTLAGRKV